jgi:hypothetical protein
MMDPQAPVTEDEVDNADAAVEELERLGATNRRCVRCGGRLIYEDRDPGFIIRCENGDFKISGRGI